MGRNVASYKFALAKALLSHKIAGDSVIRLDDLAAPFSKNICEHLRLSDKQTISRSSKFIDACRKHNKGEISDQELVSVTTRLGFNNVIDAFHIVDRADTPVRFFIDERQNGNLIRLTDHFYSLQESLQNDSLGTEVEARWRLVETAWKLKISTSLLTVSHDLDEEALFVIDESRQRIRVTSSRGALNGYQKGKCFYCRADISVDKGSSIIGDVDHFFPHRLKGTDAVPNIDGVWNLVLACHRCNRGESGKFGHVPELKYLERLNVRNNYLILSHHPLRETLMSQTGSTDRERKRFLNDCYRRAVDTLIHTWRPEEELSLEF
ncbi:MAG: HNH endonuclease [Gammaproteobacteria bacterium]|nr:HNH endonuclease [Gammaproteobacteria bacterium]